MQNPSLNIKSPLQYSVALSKCVSHKVYLKLENVQPTNSFKIRGIDQLCKKKSAEGFRGFVTFSGGNAGLSLAYVASQMKMPCHIVVPSFVSNRILNRMKSLGAQVQITATGREAYNQAVKLTELDTSLAFVHPYDDEELWAGYSKIVDEVKQQLDGEIPSCFVLSVGGGGLLMGLLTGFKAHGWEEIPIVAMETIGAHSFNKSIKVGRIVENELTSIAKTLGAPSVAPKLMEVLPDFKIISEILPDSAAVKACLRFADDHAFLVEPSCGVSLACVYKNILPDILRKNDISFDKNSGPVVVIVCGGNDCSVEILNNYAKIVGLDLQA